MKKYIFFTLILLPTTLFVYPQSPEIGVMSFNIRVDTKSDKSNRWKYRKKRVAKTILLNDIDIVGMQEVLHKQLTDIEYMLPEYTWVGVGRKDGVKKGEYAPIFYNHNKFSKIDSGYFWLSETPFKEGSVGWDAACTRIATWIKLKIIDSEKEIFVLNTHLDHSGVKAREESAKLILEKISVHTQKKNFPVVVIGDFNTPPETETIKILTDSTNPLHLTDSRYVSPVKSGPDWTFHNFGILPLEKREVIDYILIKNDVEVISYETIDGTKTTDYPSDHNAIVARLKL